MHDIHKAKFRRCIELSMWFSFRGLHWLAGAVCCCLSNGALRLERESLSGLMIVASVVVFLTVLGVLFMATSAFPHRRFALRFAIANAVALLSTAAIVDPIKLVELGVACFVGLLSIYWSCKMIYRFLFFPVAGYEKKADGWLVPILVSKAQLQIDDVIWGVDKDWK